MVTDFETGTTWEMVSLGTVEVEGKNLVFRIKGENDKDEPYLFMATFISKDASKTLSNIEKAAKIVGFSKNYLTTFMKLIAPIIPKIYSTLRISSPVEAEEETEVFTPGLIEEAKKEANRIVNSDDPLSESMNYLQKVVCGEKNNSAKLFLKCIGIKSKDNRVKWIVIITGVSGAGKSTLMRIVELLCNCKKVGRLTRHALDYMELKGYDVLVLQEVGHLDNEDHGLSTIKFVSVDDNGYTVEVPTRDPDTGEMATKTYKIPPINVLSSSTRVEFEEQFERRAEFINPDESDVQTKLVKEFKAEIERQKVEVMFGKRRWTEFDYAKKVLKEVIALIEDVSVEIPFPSELNKVIKKDVIRVRGDVDKLYSNVRLYHMLIQKSQKILEKDGKRILFASPAGAVQTVELFRDSLETMIGGIDKRTKAILTTMAKLGYSKGQKISMKQRSEIAKELSRSPTTIYNFLEKLYHHNLVQKGKEGEGKGSPVYYELLINPEELIESPISSPEELSKDLYNEMISSGYNFLRSIIVDKPTLAEIMKGWGRANEIRTSTAKQGENIRNASLQPLKQFRRMLRVFNDDKTQNNAGISYSIGMSTLPTISKATESSLIVPTHEGSGTLGTANITAREAILRVLAAFFSLGMSAFKKEVEKLTGHSYGQEEQAELLVLRQEGICEIGKESVTLNRVEMSEP